MIPPQQNPSDNQLPKKAISKRLSLQEYVEGVLQGNRVVVSKAITLVESSLSADRELAAELLNALEPHAGQSIRIGITGVPGVGKSTFIESFGHYLVKEGNKLGILTIDPSSRRSGGSIMGDKTRMETLARYKEVYIRPTPSGTKLGGVANSTRETRTILEAAGFNIILIETVGVGQSETAVADLSDFFMLLLLAGAGDELQGLKKGIMEMADTILITKADGENVQKAHLARLEFSNAVHLFPLDESGWSTRVQTCSALTNEGIAQAWLTVKEYIQFTKENGYFQLNRAQQNKKALMENLFQWMERKLLQNEENKLFIAQAEEKVLKGQNVSAIAMDLIKKIKFS